MKSEWRKARISVYETRVKPAIDRILSFGGLVLLSPLFAVLSLAVFIDDPGPVLFTQKRVGKDKRFFMLHKFRSMKMKAPHDIPTHQLKNPEQYITRVGKFLRKYSLDELPQIWDMQERGIGQYLQRELKNSRLCAYGIEYSIEAKELEHNREGLLTSEEHSKMSELDFSDHFSDIGTLKQWYFSYLNNINKLETLSVVGEAIRGGHCKNIVSFGSGPSVLELYLKDMFQKKIKVVVTDYDKFIMSRVQTLMPEITALTFDFYTDDPAKIIEDSAADTVILFGSACSMEIHGNTGIRIIEDAAHAFGSEYKGKKIGSFGDITCFSFDSIKVITCGDGGAIVMNDNELDDLAKKKRLLGIDRKTMVEKDWKKRSWVYDVTTPGYRYHLGNINAAIGLAQIRKVDDFIKRRREICYLYDKELEGVEGIECMPSGYDTITPFMYVIRVKDGERNALKDFLMEHDIESGISYIPCHHFSLFQGSEKLPVTDEIYEEILCLPIHCELSNNDVREVCSVIKQFMEK